MIVVILENDKAVESSGIAKPNPNDYVEIDPIYNYQNAFEFWKILEEKMEVFEIDYEASQPHPLGFKYSESPHYKYLVGFKYNATILSNGKIKIESLI